MIEWIVTSSILIGIVIGLRFLLKNRISCGLRYGLWLMVLLRLLIPVSLPSAFSVMNLLPDTQPVQPVTGSHTVATPDSTGEEAVPSVSKPIQAPPQPLLPQLAPQSPQQPTQGFLPLTQNPQQPIQNSQLSEPDQRHTAEDTQTLPQDPQPAVRPEHIFTVLWICGMAVFGFVLLCSNGRFLYRLRRSRTPLAFPHIRLRVYCSEVVETPCLHGLFRPAVYLPPAMTEPQDVRYALTHEHTHYRHKDHIWSMLRCICLAVHWYNPLVWVAATLSRQDAELACDESVIGQLGEEHRANYGKTLIKMACFQHNSTGFLTTSTTMLTTKKSLKERVSMIAKKPKTAIITLVCVLLIAATAAACTFTGKEKSQQQPNPQQPQQPQQQTASALPFENGEVVFVRQKGGFGSSFTITLYEDGTFKYYEGNLSSYIGYGNWKLEDGILTLNEIKFQNSFRFGEDSLAWLEEKSTGFTYSTLMQLTDGDRFILQDALPAQLGYMPELCYLPQDYLDGGPIGCFIYVDGTTYVWDHNVIDTLQDMQAEEIGAVAHRDDTVMPETHLAACRIPEGTMLYKGKDAGNSKYEAVYYKLEDFDLYARMLPTDAYRGADRWWETVTIHEGAQELTTDVLRKLQEEKGKLLSRGDLTQYGYVQFAGCPYQDYRLFQVDSNYRLLLVSPATVTDTEAMQARFYHKDTPNYWIDLMTTDIDLYQNSIYIDDPGQPNGSEIVYDMEGTVTAESLKSGVPCRVQLEKHYDGNRHLETQLIISSPTGTLREIISTGIGPVIPNGEKLYLADLDGDRVCELILHEDTGGCGGYGAYRCRVFKVDNNTLTEIFDTEPERDIDTGFYREIVEPFAFQIHNRYTGYCLKVEANQYQRARYFDETGKRNDSYDLPLNVDCFYEFYPKDVDEDGVYELCTAQYTWDNAHVDGVGDAKCVLKYDPAAKSFRVVQAEFVPYEE